MAYRIYTVKYQEKRLFYCRCSNFRPLMALTESVRSRGPLNGLNTHKPHLEKWHCTADTGLDVSRTSIPWITSSGAIWNRLFISHLWMYWKICHQGWNCRSIFHFCKLRLSCYWIHFLIQSSMFFWRIFYKIRRAD